KAPYTYSVTKGGLPVSTTALTTGLKAGTYDIVLTDALGCTSASTPITILEPTTGLSASAAAPATTTCNGTTIVTVSAAGGTGAYSYSFNGGAFTGVNTYPVNDNGLSDQVIAYQVRDANGCTTVSQNITVKKLNPPTNLAFTPSGVITCAVTSITVNLASTGGFGTLQYETITPSPIIRAKQVSNSFASLTPGTYYFKVTDANGCSYTESYPINTVTPIAVSGTKINDVFCNGGSTGSGTYNVSGNAIVGNYTFVLTSGIGTLTKSNNTLTLSNVAVGSYTVEVTDTATQCKASTTIIITEPTVALSANVAKVNANCITTTSKVTITATGGTPTYTYAYKQDNITPAAADYIISNTADLDPAVNANWDVWVKDANGCTVKLDVAVVKDLVPTVTASVLNQCGASGSTFQIKAVGAAGVAPYTYTINTGVAPSPADTFTVAAGTYTITVKDANGCTNTTSVTVYDVLDADAIKKKDLTCSLPADAQIDVTITGGKPNFSYKVKFNGGAYGTSTAVVGNTFTTNPSAAGTYQFEITDANGCKKETNVITVNPIVNPVITGITQTQDIKCNGDSTGRIVVTVPTTGEGPYQYSIDGGLYQSSNIFSDLIAGSHTVTVKDSKGCVNLVPYAFSIAQPNPIAFSLGIVNIQCTGAGNSLGSITVKNVSGGTAPFKYFISNNFGSVIVPNPYVAASNEDFTFTIIDFGIYTINVVDANGCSLSKQITMSSPPGDLLIDVTTIAADCTNGGSAKVTVTAPVLGSNYEFGILTSNTVPYASTFYPANSGLYSYIFDHLTSGVTYSFVVHDITTNCYYVNTASSPIAPVSSLKSVVTANNISCKGSMDGSVTFTVSSFDTSTTSIDYQLFASQSNAPISAVLTQTVSSGVSFTKTYPVPGTLPVGRYYIVFTEHGGVNNGCKSASEDFDIKESAVALSINASVAKNENCDNLGIITALAKDGTAPYLYMITSSAFAPSATDPAWNSTSTFTRAAGTYYVHAKDAYNCIQPSAVVNLIKDPIPVIDLSVVNKCVAEGAFGISVARTTAGVGTHSISVDNSTFTSVGAWPHTVTGLNSGSHTIVVKDANGCIDTESIIIDKPLTATPAITALPTCADNDGVITMSGIGGTGTYSYTIVPMPVGVTIVANVISKLPAGTYTVTMRDTAVPANCTTTASVTLTAPTLVTFTTTTTPALCVGQSDGSITVNLSAGNNNPSYTYEITAPIIRAAQSSNVFKGLAPGTYTVKVNSGRGCSTPANVVVAPATPIAAVTTVTNLTCGVGNVPQKAVITITGSGGTGTYQYSLDGINYSSQNVYDTYSAGNVTGYVRDTNSCVASDSKTINALNKPTNLGFTVTVAPTCPLPTATVRLTATGGVLPLQYETLPGSPMVIAKQISRLFSGLISGDYTFQVTDANGCTYQELYTVKAVTPIAIIGTLAGDISCNALNGANNNGSAKFTVTG
ncbi:SprB-like repeat protein, partial [Flavobacterium aquicola]